MLGFWELLFTGEGIFIKRTDYFIETASGAKRRLIIRNGLHSKKALLLREALTLYSDKIKEIKLPLFLFGFLGV